MKAAQGALLQLILKVAGYRRSSPNRKSGRSRRWSRSAQTVFEVGPSRTTGSMGLLIGEALEPQSVQAQIADIPGDYGSVSVSASAIGVGAFAIGSGAVARFSVQWPSAVTPMPMGREPPRSVLGQLHLVMTN